MQSSNRRRAGVTALLLSVITACAGCAAGYTSAVVAPTTHSANPPDVTDPPTAPPSASDGVQDSTPASSAPTDDLDRPVATLTPASRSSQRAARRIPPTRPRLHPSTPAAAAPSRPAVARSSAVESADELAVVAQVNAARATAGCPALTVDPTLVRLARAHSLDMGVHNYFAHDSLDGATPFARMTAAGYRFTLAAENIAAGQQTPSAVMTAWLGSPGHRANILNCGLRQIGVGVARVTGSTYGVYWTQDFGTRS